MKFLAAITALVSLASATVINKRASPLSVSLEAVGNSLVAVSITNTDSVGYNLLSKGSILDTAHVEKLQVFTAESKVAFEGVKLSIATTGLSGDAFTAIGAGETISLTVELAELHDLSAGGSFDVVAAGALQYAELGSTVLTGKALTYASEILPISVDGVVAASVPRAIQKRTVLSSDCTGTKLTALRTAFANCNTLATAAANAAASGSATKFQEYFKTTSTTTRSTVAARLRAVASDCSSTTSGKTATHCTDSYGYCTSNVLAYTLPSLNYIVYCNIFFTLLPAVSSTCHAQDQATTVIHEETHAPAVYSPGTQDLGYGYAAASALSATSALNNADQYALYANAIRVGC